MAYNCPECTKEIPAVPKDRFDEVYRERSNLKKELNDARAGEEAALAAAQTAEDLKAELAEAHARLEATKDSHGRTLAVMGAGVTDAEDIADLLAVYDRRAPEGVELSAWLENRDELPRAAAALLSTPAAAPQATAAAEPAGQVEPAAADPATPTTPPPAANNGTVPFSDSPRTWTAQNISTTDYRKNRNAIRASMGLPTKG